MSPHHASVGGTLDDPLIAQPVQRRANRGTAHAGFPNDVFLDQAISREEDLVDNGFLQIFIGDIRLTLLRRRHSYAELEFAGKVSAT